MKKLINNRAVTIVEYVMLVVVIVGALYVMKPYISRAFHGRWKATGDAFGFGRQYQAGRTFDCTYYQLNPDYGVWYDDACYAQAIVSCGPGLTPCSTVPSPRGECPPAPCRPGDIDCENCWRIICAEATKDYCCEKNEEKPGHSNCG